MISWVIIIIIVISGAYMTSDFPQFFGFRNPTRVEKNFTHYIDPYNRKNHKYPFYGYSLYGFDNPHLPDRRNNDHGYFNKVVVPLRYSGHTKNQGGIDYTGLPSSFHVRQRTI